jgi:hypothetical protein
MLGANPCPPPSVEKNAHHLSKNYPRILALTNASKSHAKGCYFEILILWSGGGFQVEYFDK